MTMKAETMQTKLNHQWEKSWLFCAFKKPYQNIKNSLTLCYIGKWKKQNIYLVHCNLKYDALKCTFTECFWLHIQSLSRGGRVNTLTVSYSFYYFIYAQFKFHFQKHHFLFFAGLSSLLTTSLFWSPHFVCKMGKMSALSVGKQDAAQHPFLSGRELKDRCPAVTDILTCWPANWRASSKLCSLFAQLIYHGGQNLNRVIGGLVFN